jgi:hypothetical protein
LAVEQGGIAAALRHGEHRVLPVPPCGIGLQAHPRMTAQHAAQAAGRREIGQRRADIIAKQRHVLAGCIRRCPQP